MKPTTYLYLLLTAFLILSCGSKPSQKQESIIYSGVPWYDQNNNTVNAHGACIVEENGKYYLFGEYKTDSLNHFIGFACYSSDNLADWKFERIVLPQQEEGLLGPDRIGERVKIMKCPSTGEFVMYMHTDDKGYYDPHIGYATCATIDGEYEFQGALLHHGQPIKRWDMGTFQDSDGRGYLLIHHGSIYRLSDDYRSTEQHLPHIDDMGESPTMFKKNGVYYLLTSNLTSWERNDNMYHTATNIEGPWVKQGFFCPEGTLTWNSQCTYVFPQVCDENTTPMYMGDRWSFPKQAAAATYVWLPMQSEGSELSIPEYFPAWDAQTFKAVTLPKYKQEIMFKSNKKGDVFEKNIVGGSRIAIFGESNKHGGYALVKIFDKQDKEVFGNIVDFYSKVPDSGTRFVSPTLPDGDYKLTIEVMGEHPTWSDKKMRIFYGSDDFYITVFDVMKL